METAWFGSFSSLANDHLPRASSFSPYTMTAGTCRGREGGREGERERGREREGGREGGGEGGGEGGREGDRVCEKESIIVLSGYSIGRTPAS